MYNPNPFEFVPFKTRTTIDRAKWDAINPVYSGWLEVISLENKHLLTTGSVTK